MKQSRVLAFWVPVLLCLLFSGCVAGTAKINPVYRPTGEVAKQAAAAAPLKVKLINFIDKREGKVEPILIGSRQAAFGTPMGDVQAARPVFEIVKETVSTELARDGYSLVDSNEDVEVTGTIQKFWVGTDVTALYWDIFSEVALQLTVVNRRTGTATELEPYGARNVERTYTYPSEEIMERVTNLSLSQVMEKMSGDPALRKALQSN